MELPDIDEANAALEKTNSAMDGREQNELPDIDEANAALEQQELPDIEEANAALGQQELPDIEEANAALGQGKTDLGVLGTLKTQKEAEFGRKLGAGEAALSYVPIMNTVMSANEKRKEDVLRRLYEGDYKNYLEGVRLAQSVDMPADVLAKIRDAATQNGPRNLLGGAMKADEETAATMFKEWAGPLLAERIKAREEAQKKLANNDTGMLEDAAVGLVGGASALASMASVPLAAATLPMDAINRGGGLRQGQWTVDENGNPSRAQLVDENGQPKVNSDGTPVISQGDSDAVALAKGFAGAAAERFIWMGLGKVVKSVGGTLVKNVPGLDKMLGKVAGKPLAWSAGLEKKLSESEGGRWLLKTGEILSNVNDTIHVGSLPSMMLKSRLTELADDVVGLNVANEGDREKFMDWAKKFVSVDDNVELLTSLIGLHVAMGGYSALRARSANKAFRTDARKVLINYLDDAQMDKMSNEDLQGLCRILQAPGLTAERAAKFLDDCRTEQAEARQKVESGEKLTEVQEGLDTLGRRSDKFMEGAEKIVDKMKSDEQKAIEAAEQARNQAIRQAEWEENNRRVEEQQRRDELSRIRGAEPSEQMAELEKRGVTNWEDAREKQLIGQDDQGRWTGGARQAINIHLNGSEKMKAAVKNGEISGDLAEELLTLGYCELGNRPKAERDAMIDKIIDECNGDAEAARARIAELKGNLYGEETLAPGETRQPETAYEGAVNAERMKGTELRSEDGALLGCERFKDVKISVNEDGIITTGLTDALMSAPENQADVAALLVRLNAIAEKTGLPINFGGDENALRVANGIMDAVEREGLAKVQKKMDTRSQLFGTLMKTTLGNGVTYDETSFKAALAKTGNGRQFVDNHGNVYGLVDGEGVIHFNPTAINYNTPIHEYGHVALEAVKKINGNLWQKGMNLIKDSPYYRELLDEIGKEKDSPYSEFGEDYLRDEALARMIGDKGERLVEGKGLGAELKAWLKDFWRAFKGAFGIADLTDEQIDKMTLGDFVDAINAELLRGKEFGTKKAKPLEKRSIRRFDEDQNSGSNGMLRWKNDRGYLFAIPVDMERTQPGGKVVFARDDANVTDWIQNALNGYTLRLSKSGKLYVEGRDGLPPELAEIFGRYPTIGQNDGIFEQVRLETGREVGDTPDALVAALRKDRASYDAWSQDKDAEAQRLADEQAHAEWLAQQRWENSGMSVADYIRSRVEEGDPQFDLDWETAREIERDRAAGRFQARAMIDGRETALAEEYPLSIRDARDPNKVLPVLSKIVGKSAAQIGHVKLTRITEKSLEHLLDSPSSRYQKSANSKAGKKLWRGTVAGISILDDIIGTSRLGQAELPKHLNKEWKKKAKFYTADTRFAVALENGKYEVYPCKLVISEIDGKRTVYDLTEIGEPTLTASGSLNNVPLAPGVNATTGTPGSTRTAVSANPTAHSVSKSDSTGNLARMSIAGRFGAENMGIGNMNEAEAMENSGASREDVWRKTGWWRGQDGKWRVEIPDVKMKNERELFAALVENHNDTTLGRIMDAPELFRAYPQLKDTRIILSPETVNPGEPAGWYDRVKNEITLFDAGLISWRDRPRRERDLLDYYTRMVESDEYRNNAISKMDAFGIEHGTDAEEREYARLWVDRFSKGINRTNETRIRDLANDRSMRSVFGKIVHEVQHAIQRIEGFARGASGEEDGYSRFAGEVEARNAARRETMTAEERAATPPWKTEDVPEDRQTVRFSVARRENEAWIRTVDSFSSGKIPRRTDLTVLPRVPAVISRVLKDSIGVDVAGKNIVISSDCMNKAMTGKHRVSPDEMKKLVVSLDAPLAIFQSKTRPLDSITALVGIRDRNGGISSVVPIDYTARRENGQTTLRITSVYGRLSRDSVQSWIDDGYLLYADRKNISRSFPHGLQLPGRTKTANRFLDENDFSEEALGIVSNPVDAGNGLAQPSLFEGATTFFCKNFTNPLDFRNILWYTKEHENRSAPEGRNTR